MDSNRSSPTSSTPTRRGVVVLGSFIVDLAFMSERMPVAGETIRGDYFALGAGGKGSNQAIAAARAGANVVLITAVGEDRFASLAEDTLRREGIALKHLNRFSDAQTGVAFIHVDTLSGENRIIVVPSANDRLEPCHVAAASAEIARASVLLSQLEQPLGTAEAAFREARRHGVCTVFNPAPAAEVGDDVLALCDYVTPNESEASALTGQPVETQDQVRAAARTLRARGAGGVVITLGARGAYLLDAQHDRMFSPFAAGKVVDTTGAGDAFNGAFAAALAAGADSEQAVLRGCAAGALCVTRSGTSAAMPLAHEIDSLVAIGNLPLGSGK
jgi:ribokinase